MISILEKEKQESAKDYVLRVLIHSIVNAELKPGERLVDQEICNLLGVSRTPFREAELGLAQKKLIEIKPKIGTYVSYIDPGLVEEVRHLRSVLEAEIAVMACDLLTSEDIDRLWENIALWQLYIKRGDEEKMFYYDKEFHKMLYHMCGRSYWCELVEGVAPHFDRTTILSFRCQTKEKIYKDHEELLEAIEHKDKEKAREIARRHMERYIENIGTIQKEFPDYFIQ